MMPASPAVCERLQGAVTRWPPVPGLRASVTGPRCAELGGPPLDRVRKARLLREWDELPPGRKAVFEAMARNEADVIEAELAALARPQTE